VHVAFLTMVTSLIGLICSYAYPADLIRSALLSLFAGPTGRQHERSTKLPAAEAAFDPARLKSAGLNLGPGRNIFFRQDAVADGLLVFVRGIWITHLSSPLELR
jgi:hypothetical protein